MVLVNFAKDENGCFLGKSGRVAESMHHTFANIWRELVTPEEFEATNFPNQVKNRVNCSLGVMGRVEVRVSEVGVFVRDC